MKDILLGAKTQLRADQDLKFVRAPDIYITEAEYLFPKGVCFPAIALKDGPILNLSGTNLRYFQQIDLRVSCYVSIKKPEESITGRLGVLAVVELIRACLNNNCLGVDGVDSALPHTEEPSEVFGDEEVSLQKKTIIMRYIRQKSLPRRS